MEITIEKYSGKILFQIKDVSQEEKNSKIKNYDYPFNVEFKKIKEVYKGDKKKAFNGSGIYLITYKKEIIYIGK